MLSEEHNTSLSKVAEVLLKDWAKGEKDGVILAMEIKAEGGFLSFVRDKPFIHPPFRAQKKGWSQKLAVSAQRQSRRAVKEQRNWLISNAH